MDNNKSKIITIIAAVIGVIGVILFVRVLMAGNDTDSLDGAVGAIVSYSYWLLIIVSIIAVGLSLIGLVKHPKALKKTLLGVVILAVLLLISYFMASDAAVKDGFGNIVKNGEAGSVSKWVSTLINFTGILSVLALIAVALGFFKSTSK